MQPPKPATLKKYGLTEEDWRALAESQGYVCFVCKRKPSSGRLCIDHEHVKGWKRMPPSKRRQYVRGLLCWQCNHWYLCKGINQFKASHVVTYLNRYEFTKEVRRLGGWP